MKEFSTIYNPSSCLRLFKNVTSIEKSLEANTPTLGKLVKTYGDTKIEAYLKIWLINLNESLNLKRPLTESQISETAFMILDGNKNLTISDINLIFKRAKSGEYGPFFESLSIDKVLTWFSQYFEERCNIAAELTRRKADQEKYQEDKTIGSNRTGMQKLRDSKIFEKNNIKS